MHETQTGSSSEAGIVPLFLLSFRHRDELAAAASRGGWRAIAARRASGIERRFVASGATIAVVDARGALDEGLGAVRALADPAQANAAALLVLVSRTDTGSLGAFFEAGATHYLASPFGDAEFAQALRFAGRHAERLAGGWDAGISRASLLNADVLSWRQEGDAFTLSPALAARISKGVTTATARGLYRTLGSDDRQAARAAFARLKRGEASTAFSHVLANGERVAHHLSQDDGVTRGVIEPLASDRLMTIAGQRDGLTGLVDAIAARRWLATQIARGEAPTLLLVAISRFEIVNTAYGRAAGDALLQAAARRIERVAGELGGRGAIIARMAGAEFMIGLRGAGLERARFVAEQMIEAIERRFMAGSEMIALGCRVGLVEAGPADDDPVALLRRASAALADAKAAESGAVRVLSRHEEHEATRHRGLESDLRQALSQGDIETLFQPQVSVTSGRIVGVEALARWRHPDHGELGANILFAAAERSDYLMQLSEHVQRRAMEAAAAWPEALSRLRLSVNVTAADIARPRFVEHFLAMVDEIGLARDRLTIEVTESGLIEDLNAAAGLLAEVRAGGCRVAIDDFGTGYSSLAYLKALPLDYLKIDQHLSQDIAGSARDRIVVRGVIEMALSLGLGVIAEGVETDEQLALLAREGCTLYQGFLCAEPISSEELERLVLAQD